MILHILTFDGGIYLFIPTYHVGQISMHWDRGAIWNLKKTHGVYYRSIGDYARRQKDSQKFTGLPCKNDLLASKLSLYKHKTCLDRFSSYKEFLASQKHFIAHICEDIYTFYTYDEESIYLVSKSVSKATTMKENPNQELSCNFSLSLGSR